ncbi:hypothetical protein U1Q18_019696 [Sarracenia purpurea var. burkii]
MAEEEQVKPLAPAAKRISIDDDYYAAYVSISTELRHQHRPKNCVKCCGCIAALILIQAVIVLVLIFTVFHVKDPVLKMNSVKIQGLDLINGATLRPGANLTVTADVSVKNPNIASFKFSNATTTTVYYDGVVVGEGRNPPGVAKARRTLRRNVTIDVMLERILVVPRLRSDLSFGALNISSFTSVSGRVKILKIFKKHVVVKMNCTMTVNVTSQAIQDQNCRPSVSI